MARIDFHSNVSDKLEYVCRLTRKIWSATQEGQPVRNIVIVGEKADLKKLDELLWTFSGTDFLPHCNIEDEAAAETPIVMTDDFASPALYSVPHADVMIHIGMQMPPNVPALVERFPRIVEVVTINEAERLAGRERFKAYRDLGHELHNFDQSKS
ncbi:DNA polymerase III subunit chi [Polynucleobacter wuianus]|uniref:DNA polymerase III subunit chi n=1 Tax=Polynucleobacter wuianus TaxID=1743168 RepID=A0A191UFU9_9BURK|nr:MULTISPECIES: DNA polymerase III subunit chi [Polynucleobacter]ANI99893.1 DNA polymerase III subunit chi [Polynucleobacter wuianus]MBU3552720.1 DNA polymerase III subunit chi [Polynucleobacter sp. MWH-Post4-6-1]MBU3610624.1 DNA polymerase III subunit chi [Polynucleobacter wuianus]